MDFYLGPVFLHRICRNSRSIELLIRVIKEVRGEGYEMKGAGYKVLMLMQHSLIHSPPHLESFSIRAEVI